MSTCRKAQILWDPDNAKWFGELCRRTMGMCEQDQPCPSLPAEGWILLVSSHRGLTCMPATTGPAEVARPEASRGRSRRDAQDP
jgi:hypothetical protein